MHSPTSHKVRVFFCFNPWADLEGLELVNANADLFVLVQGGQLGGDLTLDPVDHVLGLLLGQGGLDGDLEGKNQIGAIFSQTKVTV